jgi:hypothetical protein
MEYRGICLRLERRFSRILPMLQLVKFLESEEMQKCVYLECAREDVASWQWLVGTDLGFEWRFLKATN